MWPPIGLAVGGATLLASEELTQGALRAAMGVAAVAALVAAIRLHRPLQPLAWLFVALGLLARSVADAGGPWPAGEAGSISVGEAVELVSYPLLLVGLLGLVAGRAHVVAEARRTILDSAVVAVSMCLLSWFSLGPGAFPTSSERVLAAATGTLDVFLVAAALRLGDAAGFRCRSAGLLSTGLAVLSGSHVLGTHLALTASGSVASLADGAIPLGYGLLTAAFLHPSMADVSPRRETEKALPLGRLAVLATSALALPAVLVADSLEPHSGVDRTVLAAGATGLVALLLARLVGLVRSVERREGEIRYLAVHDPLTGLPNRRVLEETLGQVVQRARGGRHAALLVIDVDRFKRINDTAGHLGGDRALVEVGAALGGALRPGDLLARLGGDEFAAIVHDVAREEARQVADRVVEAIASLRFRDAEHAFDLTASVGACVIDGSLDSQKVMSVADSALYEAKERGRNRAVVAEDGLARHREVARANRWATRIKDALDDGRLLVALQPIVSLGDRRVAYHEALARLLAEEGRLAAAGEFIPVAEQFGLMARVDRHVFESAVRLVRSRPGLRVLVNLSAESFDDDSLLDLIEARLGEAAIAPGSIGFEITETIAMRDIDLALRRVRRLKELDCSVALDDFGTGFSSLLRLRELPVDFVKIGPPFTSGCPRDVAGCSVVKGVVEVSRVLGKQVIAEAVETNATAEALRDLGVEYGQGFLFGRPSLARVRVGAEARAA